MQVTVIRHGTAEDRAATDAERALTSRGRDEVAAAVERLAGLAGESPDCIVSSPLLRARQTAEIVARRVAFTGTVQIEDALMPDAEPAGVGDLVARLGARRHVVLVAHEPILSAACSWLTGTVVSSLRKEPDATVVITHFAPSFRSADPRYGAQPGTASFCNADDDLITKADLWIHGHLHCRHDYRVREAGRETRVVCNARGHGKRGEAEGYDGLFTVEV